MKKPLYNMEERAAMRTESLTGDIFRLELALHHLWREIARTKGAKTADKHINGILKCINTGAYFGR